MGRRNRNRRILVPEAREGLDRLKAKVMAKQGYTVDPDHPEQVKYEVAKEVGVPLDKDYNGNLTAKEAGKIGGPIGGNMVSEMVKMAKAQLGKKQ
ncbi:alpha/beta-type small acid-soluble spore protein [Fictibacillus gelatini]|uniref:alpha/beta-type small acid-soluble spore protein n=1 Tax=Fictibacillus gelatini TaxID=225985 RepID=UPI0004208F7F|nr:alpha/beta-type small acid-soluble spore protein [Fictibacillus gelatini]